MQVGQFSRSSNNPWELQTTLLMHLQMIMTALLVDDSSGESVEFSFMIPPNKF